ncbi:hypothetical protein ETH_00016385 [Eimeria tenella]|uniref:DNA2/NAM7 helicase helicase domain-containing protein n=1 Tax=Eimeria tenella TaxID=5802 RepID=U6KHW3_EIMTE|nr:hypothetical protein ETH_00016385 [Eimeria tenella]CDJ37630.1 hypothetical protein ETH_00016385 [Eimeria tenella]|eukprot:XP_013228468.1 hypothetical protein ETH_00016385 [Eimeria tenella]
MLELQRKKQKEGELCAAEERLLRTLIFKCELEVLLEADVVCVTCLGAGDKRVSQLSYRAVLIDEATQATEPEALVPLTLGANQVILIGDQMQLGPVVLSKRAAASGLGVSLFVRLLLLNMPAFRLSVQYR